MTLQAADEVATRLCFTDIRIIKAVLSRSEFIDKKFDLDSLIGSQTKPSVLLSSSEQVRGGWGKRG